MNRRTNQFLAATLLMGGLCSLPYPVLAQDEAPPAQPITIAANVPSLNAEKSSTTGPKRVWTNDDFAASSQAAEPKPEEAQSAPAITATAPTQPASEADSPELQKARQEVSEEMLATARARQKAYDDTLSLVKAKLETETDPFRIEVYQKILKDTVGLQEINQQILKQFGDKAGAAEQEPSASAEPQALATATEPK